MASPCCRSTGRRSGSSCLAGTAWPAVKWLGRIEALSTAFDGFQQVRTYRFRESDEDPGRPVTTMRGEIADGAAGRARLEFSKTLAPARAGDARRCVPGRAAASRSQGWKWNLTVNGARPRLQRPVDAYAWRQMELRVGMPPRASMCCAAAPPIALGNVQPLDPPWDVAGFANNAAQKVQVFVAEA